MTVDVAVPGMSHKFTITSDNKLVLQRLEVIFAFTTHFLELETGFTTIRIYLHVFITLSSQTPACAIFPDPSCHSYSTFVVIQPLNIYSSTLKTLQRLRHSYAIDSTFHTLSGPMITDHLDIKYGQNTGTLSTTPSNFCSTSAGGIIHSSTSFRVVAIFAADHFITTPLLYENLEKYPPLAIMHKGV